MAYEMMQIDGDFTWKTISLDSDYFVISEPRYEYAIEVYSPVNDTRLIELRVGDIISVDFVRHNENGRLRNSLLLFCNFMGYKKGKNLRTNQHGFFPANKTVLY
jgi:hypothetical protein